LIGGFITDAVATELDDVLRAGWYQRTRRGGARGRVPGRPRAAHRERCGRRRAWGTGIIYHGDRSPVLVRLG